MQINRLRPFLLALGVLAPLLGLAQTNLRVMTWNIDRGIGSNSPNSGEQGGITKIVNYEHPDVWTINELGGNSSGYNSTAEQAALVSYINANITAFGPSPQLNVNYYVYVGVLSDGFISNAIVSRYPIVSTQFNNDGLRGMQEATINVNGTLVGVFTTHLKALSSTSDAQTRQTEAESDASYITAWKLANPGKPFFLTGDWNESEDSNNTPSWSGGIGGTLPNGHIYHPITTMKSVGVSDPKPTTIKGFTNTESVRSEPPNIRFDYNTYFGVTYTGGEVFDTAQYTPPQLAALNAANGTNFSGGDSAVASDHAPVTCNYQIPSAAVIAGHVTLGEFGGTIAGTPITIKVLQAGTSTVLDTISSTLNASGNFSVSTGRTGTYDVDVKASHWLSQLLTGVVFTGSGASGLSYVLTNGDADNDNVVGPLDLNVLRSNFGGSNAAADLDGDGVVGPLDLNIIRNHFGQSGT